MVSMTEAAQSRMLKPIREVGIAGYGAYVPRFRLPASEVARIWKGADGGLPIKEKAVPGLDEDVITMSIEAARNALARASVDPSEIRAVWVGSESHPYAVKPTSTVVAEAIMESLGTTPADYRYAVFHQPNAKFPQRVAASLGFRPEQIETGLLVSV